MKIKINGINYELIEEDKQDKTEDGRIAYQQCKIFIGSNHAEDYKKSVLTHEIIHGLLIDTDYQNDEELVTILQHRLFEFIRNNSILLYTLSNTSIPLSYFKNSNFKNINEFIKNNYL